MNLIKLEDFTPYQNSLKWKIHNEYFKKRGALAWINSEVPYVITSNYQFAYQKAKVIIESLKSYESELGDQIKILEIGSGGGLFAFNFIKAFKNICEKENKEYFYDKLHYMFTDYSEKNLEDASENAYLIKLKKEGKLDFYVLNALATKKIKTLDGKSILLSKNSIDAVVCSYVYCTLPTAIIKKENNKYFEKQIALYIRSEKKVEELTINKIFSNISDYYIVEDLEEEIYYKEIDVNNYIQDEGERGAFLELTDNFEYAVIEYSAPNLKNMREILNYLKDKSVFIISDKGTINKEYFETKEDSFFSVHKNSIAHSVNFPLLEKYISKLNAYSIYSKDNDFVLHSFLATKNLSEDIKNVFEIEFIQNNYNDKLNNVVRKLYNTNPQDYIEQMNYYLSKLDHNEKDATISYYLSKTYNKINQYTKVIELLEKKPQDFFFTYDFYFEKAFAHEMLEQYEEALLNYNKSLKIFGADENTYYSMANIQYKLKKNKEAYINYKKSLLVNPNFNSSMNELRKFTNSERTKFEQIDIKIKTHEEFSNNATDLIYEYISDQSNLELLVKASVNVSLAILKEPLKIEYYELLIKIYKLIGNEKKEKEIREAIKSIKKLINSIPDKQN